MIRVRPASTLLGTALFFALAAGAASYLWDRYSFRSAKRQGLAIAKALVEYRDLHGIFPSSLHELTPEFLERTPSPRWGLGRWEYVVLIPEQEFMLSLCANESCYPALHYVYKGSDGDWWFDE